MCNNNYQYAWFTLCLPYRTRLGVYLENHSLFTVYEYVVIGFILIWKNFEPLDGLLSLFRFLHFFLILHSNYRFSVVMNCADVNLHCVAWRNCIQEEKQCRRQLFSNSLFCLLLYDHGAILLMLNNILLLHIPVLLILLSLKTQ